jgi:uncharacterized damage-inducible protein DinB
MSLKRHFERLAAYNRWMNVKVYDASARMDEADLHADKGAFFGSVFGTLNHLRVADTIWLKRFTDHPTAFEALAFVRPLPNPYSLDELQDTDLAGLRRARQALDEVILALTAEATDADYEQTLTYANRAGEIFHDPFATVIQHFFNHQTHHRGQVTTLLTQAGIDVGVTDLIAMVRKPDSA